MRAFLLSFLLLAGLAACTDATSDLAKPVEPLGDFRLGHVGVVAPNLQKLLISRDVAPEVWTAEVERAVRTRFERFEGDKFYHLGISVEAYSLPPPVIPGKSALAVRVTVWDDATQTKLNPETEMIHVIKVFESRLSKTPEVQQTQITEEVVREIELWMRRQQEAEGWFGGPAETPAGAPAAAAAATPEEDAADAASAAPEGAAGAAAEAVSEGA